MPDDQSPPAHSDLVAELKVVRRRGRGRLRNRALPALEQAARLVTPDRHDLVDAIDKLVERAIAKLGDGQLGQAAKLLFGYTLDKRGVAVSELRREVARIYGVTPESFRHGAEKTIIDEVATEILRLIDWDRVSPEAAVRDQDEELPTDDVDLEERPPLPAGANIAVKDANVIVSDIPGTIDTPEDTSEALNGNEILRSSGFRLFMAPTPSFVIPRERLTSDVLDLLAESDGDGVGVVAVVGAGGFGKTALIMDLCRRPEMTQLFPDGVLWITVGRDTDDLALASKINDLSEIVYGERPALVDPLQAGFRLGELLGQRRALLVLDDVWSLHQIRPFLYGARHCRRLMTTRNLTALPETARQVIVETMTPQEASQLLTHGVPSPDAIDIEPLIAHTRSWPLLIALVNSQICTLVHARGLTVTGAVAEVTEHLRAAGPTVPDVVDPVGRSQAVEAILRASLALLDDRMPRYLELAVFPEDCDIPREVLETYWAHTAHWSIPQVHEFCKELTALSLIQTYRAGLPRLRLHDILRDYLQKRAGEELAVLHAALLDGYRVKYDIARHGGWWSLPATELYLWSHLFGHLQQAGHYAELHRTATDLRYAVSKIKNKNTLALESDLSTVSSEGVADALRRAIARSSHLLRSDDPWNIIAATLASQLKGINGHLGGLNRRSIQSSSTPYLEAEWPKVLQPDPSLYRVLISGADPINTVSFSPDDQLVAAAGADGALRLWDTITGHPQHILTGNIGAINAIAFSPDGQLLASAGSDGTITLWESATGTLRSTLTGHTASVLAVVFSPRGESIASAGEDGSVRLWETTTSAAVQTWTGHSGPVSTVEFSPDGQVVASAGDDNTVRVWDVSKGSLRHTLSGHQQAVLTVAFSPDSQIIASSGDDGKVCLWNVIHGQLGHVLASPGFWGSAIFSPDGRRIVSASIDGSHMGVTVRVWDTATGSGLHKTYAGSHYPAWKGQHYSFGSHRLPAAMAFSPDGKILVIAGGGTIHCWDPLTGRDLFNLIGHTNNVASIALSENGHYLASASWDGSVRLWSMIHPTPRGAIPLSWPAGGTVTSVACSPSGVIAIACDPGGAWVLTADSDNRETCMLYGLALPHTVAFSCDGNLVASGDNLGGVAIWSLPSNRSAAPAMKSPGSPSLPRLPSGGATNPTVQIGHGNAVRAVAFSPDGQRLLSAGDDGVVRMWDLTYTRAGDLTSIQPAAAWPSRVERILALAWSPDGQAVAIGGTDGRVWLHDVTTGTLQRSFAALTSTVNAVAFDPHGMHIAASGPDGALRLWSLATNETHSIAGHQGTVEAVAFCPNGKYLASAAHDGTVRLWSVPSGSFLTGIRIDDTLSGLAWIPAAHRLVVVGERGIVYMFSSVDNSTPRPSGH